MTTSTPNQVSNELVNDLQAVRSLAVRGLNWYQQRMTENPREDDAGKEDGLIATMEAFDAAILKVAALVGALALLADVAESYQRGDDDAVPLALRGVTASDVLDAVNAARQALKLAGEA